MENKLGNYLKEAREKKGISKIELAKRIGINKSSMYRIENGEFKKPSVEILMKLSKELNLSIDKLLKIARYEEESINFINNYFPRIEGSFINIDREIVDEFTVKHETLNEIDIRRVLQAYKESLIDEITTIKLLALCEPIEVEKSIIYVSDKGNIDIGSDDIQ